MSDPSQYRISVDLDGVTFDFHGAYMAAYAKEFNQSIPPAHLLAWNTPLDHTHFESYDDFFAWVDERNIWANSPMIEGAQDGIDELLDSGYDVWFMTARQGLGAQWTREWFHDSPWHADVTLATDMHDKTELNAHAYVDDRPKTLLQVDQTTDALPICFLQPWNDSGDKWKLDAGDFDPPAPSARVVAARGWKDVVKAIHLDFSNKTKST